MKRPTIRIKKGKQMYKIREETYKAVEFKLTYIDAKGREHKVIQPLAMDMEFGIIITDNSNAKTMNFKEIK